MMFNVNISRQAEEDMRNIFEYIAYELKSFQNASGQLSRLEAAILSLDCMPDRYRVYSAEPWKTMGLRVMPVDKYLVFYIPDHGSMNVDVLRVMYGGMNVEAQLRNITN